MGDWDGESFETVAWRLREVDGQMIPILHRAESGGELVDRRRPVYQEPDEDRVEVVAPDGVRRVRVARRRLDAAGARG